MTRRESLTVHACRAMDALLWWAAWKLTKRTWKDELRKETPHTMTTTLTNLTDSELTDRAAELRKALAATENAHALIAQTHAPLALVEQQRIANLIALAECGRTTVNGARAARSGLYDGAVEDGAANMHIRADGAAALGIEAP